MTRQMGNSGRGMENLPPQGGAEEREEERDSDELLADGELVGNWSDSPEGSGYLASGEQVGPWTDDDLDPGVTAEDADVDEDDL